MNIDAVLTQMRNAGLLVDSIDTSGKIVRVPVTLPRPDKGKDKSGWYVVHEFRLSSGAIGLAGSFGNYKNPDAESCKIGMQARELSERDKREYEIQRRRAAKQVAEEARKAAEQCAERAAKIWAGLPEEGGSKYLDKKGVRAYGLRFSRGSVVVPLYRCQPCKEGEAFGVELVGLQFIDGEGVKKFLTGTPKKGAFHWLGSVPTPNDAAHVVVVEGYATGASVHMATGLPVAVAFDAGNLAPVAKALRAVLPNALLCIAGDTDPDTGRGNTGLVKAKAAAEAVNGVWVVPEFAEAAHGPE